MFTCGDGTESQSCRRINHRAHLFSVHTHFHERTGISCYLERLFAAVGNKRSLIGEISAVERHALRYDVHISYLFRHFCYLCGCARQLHTEFTEYKAALKLGYISEAIVYHEAVCAFIYFRQSKLQQCVLVYIVADDIVADIFAVEYDIIRIFEAFECQLRTLIFDIALEIIVKRELILRIFIKRLCPWLFHMASAPTDAERIAHSHIGIENIAFALYFTAVQAV